MYHRSKLSELNHFQVQREIRIHAGLDHRNIIPLVSTCRALQQVWPALGQAAAEAAPAAQGAAVCAAGRRLLAAADAGPAAALLQYAAFEDPQGVYLVTEYATRGDVFAEVERRGGRWGAAPGPACCTTPRWRQRFPRGR
jgi:hypothetical protein